MEDPDVHRKIEEYCSSSDYIEEEGKSHVKWILEKGLGIGKKVVIAGFVISSAPLVLPSIIIVSALGMAFSVPFGLVFASYTCTQKLMNKLLPIPTSSPMLEYDIMFEDENEKDREPEEKEDGIAYTDMEKEENEQMEDIKEGIEERLELVAAENELPQDVDDDLKEIRKNDEERLARGNGSSKEEGYEEDDDESLEEKEERSGEVIDVKVEGEGVEGEDEAFEEESKDEKPLLEVKRIVVVVGGEKRSADSFGMSEDLVLVARRVGGVVQDNQTAIDYEEKDLKKETVGLLEKIRDEGNAGDAANGKSHVEGGDNLRNVGIMKELEINPIEKENEYLETLETASLLEDKNKKLQKVVEEAIGSDKINEDEKYLEDNPTKQGGINENNLGSVAKEVEPAVKMEDILLEKKGAGNRNNVVARELTVDYSTLIEGKHAAENGHCILAEKQKPAPSSEVTMHHEGARKDDDSDLEAIHPNGVTREAADEKDSADQTFSEGHKNYQGNERATDPIVNENVDLVEVPVTARRPEPEHDDYTSRMDSVVPSEKEPVAGDKKIWEQIDALRTIVGYRATSQRSCFDEVRALYIFTGVEPPSSFENTTELHDKLRFLMSIVGVK